MTPDLVLFLASVAASDPRFALGLVLVALLSGLAGFAAHVGLEQIT